MYCRSWDPQYNYRFWIILEYTPLTMVYTCFFIKLELERGYPLSSWPPLMHWFQCIPLSCLPWIFGTWCELPWRGLPWNLITYGSWGCIWYVSKVLISLLMRPLFLLDWNLGFPMRFLVPSGFHSWWIQPLISKVREIVLIIICTLEGLKGVQSWPNWRFLILYCMHSLKIFTKHQMKPRADVSGL